MPGVSLKALDLVFVTHLHSDHVLELGPLLHTAWTAGLATPVSGLRPGRHRPLLAALPAVDGIRHRDPHRRRRPAGPARPGLDFGVLGRAGARRSRSRRHARCASTIRRSPIAMRCASTTTGRSVVFSADTAYFPPLADFARGADILVHEAMLDRRHRPAGRPHRQRRAAEAAPAGQPHAGRATPGASPPTPRSRHLVLNHLIPADDPDDRRGRLDRRRAEKAGRAG